MKKKMVLVIVAFLLVFQAQMVFAGPNEDFAKELDRNNIGNIEKLLQRKAKEMNLSYCIISVQNKSPYHTNSG